MNKLGLGWIRPGIWGAVIGAVVITYVGFNYWGWTTAGSAMKMAEERVQAELAKALVPLCIQHASLDPKRETRFKELEKESSWSRGVKVASFGWATFEGMTQPNKVVAEACAAEFSKTFENKNL